MITDSFLSIGLEKMTGGKRAFISFTKDLLFSKGQECLWLLALKHNIEPFAHGKRKGHSPFELLGIDLGTNDWVDLVLTYQP